MSEVVTQGPPSPIGEMQTLMGSIHKNGYSDVDELRRFIILYEYCIPHSGQDDTSFYEALDIPELEFVFNDDTFDDIVSAYDSLGGEPISTYFPDTGHIPSASWSEELTSLLGIMDKDSIYTRSYALYIRQNASHLRDAETDGTNYRSLLSNPNFLHGLAKVYAFEQQETIEKRDLPSFWPAQDDNFLDDVLEAVGYHYAASFKRDWAHTRDGVRTNEIADNLEAIADLERIEPGATRALSEQYGIRNFSRYPTELLVKQHQSGGVVDRPYGVIIGAAQDHNGALLGVPGWRREYGRSSALYEQTVETHDLLVAEAETSTEFEQRLKQFDKTNGDKYKLDFAVVESHGSPHTLAFGREPSLGRLALGHKLQDTRKLFSKRASVLLTGCSTGKASGIAQSLSWQFDTTVVAPNEDTGMVYLAFIPDPDATRLVPVFADQVPAIVYKGGSPLGTKKAKRYLDIRPADTQQDTET